MPTSARRLALSTAVFAGASLVGAPAVSAQTTASMELVMLVDSSGSIDNTEFALQRQGYIDAFRDPAVQAAVASRDGVAVRLAYWSNHNQLQASSWYVLHDAADCDAFSTVIEGMSRPFSSGTDMAPALDWAVADLTGNTIASSRMVIDVSGDGICEVYKAAHGDGDDDDDDDDGGSGAYDWDTTMTSLETNGVVLNAISVGNTSGLEAWYADNLPTGPGSFAMHANDFVDFGEGIKQKLIREITPTVTAALYD